MKRIYTMLMLVMTSMAVFAQNNPNRLLVREKSGDIKGFLVENIDSVFFVKEEGRVAADIEFLGYTAGDDGDAIQLKVIRTKNCEAFRISILPTNTANQLADDLSVAKYLEMTEPNVFYEDFTNGTMKGFDPLKENAAYTILTIGYDKYGIACSAARATFTTPKKPVLGNPQVDYKITEVSADGVTIELTPNADTGKYAYCLFTKGELQMQFEMFGPMFGLSSVNEMVFQWGKQVMGDCVASYNDLDPGKDYELYVQPLDKNGSYADLICIPFTTESLGGTGLAEVGITLGKFEKNNDSYQQYITFTPNAEAALMHVALRAKESLDPVTGEQEVLETLKSDKDPEFPMNPYWDIYIEDTYVYNVQPNTTYVIYALAKNANGEWGTLASEEFTTPDAPAAAQVKVGRNGTIRPIMTDNAKKPQLTIPTWKMRSVGKKGITLK